jgi:hypothetical protein
LPILAIDSRSSAREVFHQNYDYDQSKQDKHEQDSEAKKIFGAHPDFLLRRFQLVRQDNGPWGRRSRGNLVTAKMEDWDSRLSQTSHGLAKKMDLLLAGPFSFSNGRSRGDLVQRDRWLV